MGLLEDANTYLLSGKRKTKARGRSRAVVLAIREEIARALEGGISVLVCWEVLTEQKKLTMSYESFRQYVNREILKKPKSRVTPKRGAETVPAATQPGAVPASSTSSKAVPGDVPSAEKAVGGEVLPALSGPASIKTRSSSDRAFDFNPVPKKR